MTEIATDRHHTACARADPVTVALPAGSRLGNLTAHSLSMAGESPTDEAELLIILVPEPHTSPHDLALLARTPCRES
jgi:hypothetical protein